MSVTTLYIIAIVLSVAVANCLVFLARSLHQAKMPPEEKDYLELQNELHQAKIAMEGQNQDLMDLQVRLEELKEQLSKEIAEKNSLAQEAANAPPQAKAANE